MWIIVFFLCGEIIYSFKRFLPSRGTESTASGQRKRFLHLNSTAPFGAHYSAAFSADPFYIFKIFLTTNQIIKIIKNDISNAAAGERYANLPFMT